MQLDVAKTAFYQVDSAEDEDEADSKDHDEGYFDDEEGGSDEIDKANSRDVGHNIYILAHQVSCLFMMSNFVRIVVNIVIVIV